MVSVYRIRLKFWKQNGNSLVSAINAIGNSYSVPIWILILLWLTWRYGGRGTGHAGHQIVGPAGRGGRHGRHFHFAAVRGRGRGGRRCRAGRRGRRAVCNVITAGGRRVVWRRHGAGTTAGAGLHGGRRGRCRVGRERVHYQGGCGRGRVGPSAVVVSDAVSITRGSQTI